MANTQSKLGELSAHSLLQQLIQIADQHKIKTWCLAYSGGVDSQVLLHLLHLTKLDVQAVYIDHGLQAISKEWAVHCAEQCEKLNIPFQVIKVNAVIKGESPEAAARTARYTALKKIIKKNMCLLTAQHQDDQAETVLLQLLRGGGAAGLAGMPLVANFAEGQYARPLLNVSQQSILDYAEKYKLQWVEDPSNQQDDYDRNYLRHTVLPNLQNRWPVVNKTLCKFSKQQAENAQLLDALAEIDLQSALTKRLSLNITRLKKLTDARLRNTLRYWFKQHNTESSRLPSRAILQQIVQQIQIESHDTHALISWSNVEVRRFRDELFYLIQNEHDAKQILQWDGKTILKIDSLAKQLQFQKNETEYGLSESILNDFMLTGKLQVRFRQGGEKIKPAGRQGSRDLKSLFQENNIPNWLRDKTPLLYADDVLIAVVGICVADEYADKGKDKGLVPILL